jgi:glyoxylase-like metal-dependent hydrolase (beta-lactamase superfamily II)
MNIQGKQLKANSTLSSGGVRRFVLPHGKIHITQITTFCPSIIGPGPTHLYLIEGDVLVLMDTGIPTQLAKSLFYDWRSQPMPPEVENLPSDLSEQQLLEGLRLANHSIKDIDILVISHGHPDHFLLGHSILDQGNPRIIAHLFDTPAICNPWGMLQQSISRMPHLLAMGVPPPKQRRESLARAVNPETFKFSLQIDSPVLDDGPLQINGTPIKGIEVKHLPGHSPGSIGLILGDEGEDRVLLCGDVLLYPITPHPNDLLEYLRTLKELNKLDHIGLVLPAHGKAIRNLKARVAFLQEHHRRRLRLTYEACQKPRSVWEVATIRRYFKIYVDPGEFNPLAGTEALVHLEILKMVDGLYRSHIQEGVHYFQNSGEPFDDVYGRVMDFVEDRKVSAVMRY